MAGLFGYLPLVAAAFGIPQYLPQFVRLRTTRDTAGVSWSWATLTSLDNAAWLGYFAASRYWAATVPATCAAVLAGVIAAVLTRRGCASTRAGLAIAGWVALLVAGFAVAGRAGLGALLTGAFAVQVVPSLWTAYRTARPTGLAP